MRLQLLDISPLSALRKAYNRLAAIMKPFFGIPVWTIALVEEKNTSLLLQFDTHGVT